MSNPISQPLQPLAKSLEPLADSTQPAVDSIKAGLNTTNKSRNVGAPNGLIRAAIGGVSSILVQTSRVERLRNVGAANDLIRAAIGGASSILVQTPRIMANSPSKKHAVSFSSMTTIHGFTASLEFFIQNGELPNLNELRTQMYFDIFSE